MLRCQWWAVRSSLVVSAKSFEGEATAVIVSAIFQSKKLIFSEALFWTKIGK